MINRLARAIPLTRGDGVFLVLVTLYALMCWALASFYGLADRFYPVMYLRTGTIMTGGLAALFLLGLALRAYYVMIFIRPEKLTAHLWQELKNGPLRRGRLSQAIPIFIGMVVFLSSFTSMKQLIPGIHPFSWDETFALWDRALHFGRDPWALLHPVFGYAPVTWAINLVYNLWLPILFAVLYWQAFSLKDPATRMRFFYAFALIWAVNGTFLAIALSSAGPCFLERLTGAEDYRPLMDYLRGVDGQYGLFAIKTQDAVWAAASANQSMIGGGISAMPSIHVATALLFLLTARAMRAAIWPVFALFLAVIMIGAVHLGWHYAIDGYLAAVTTLTIWLTTGRFLRFSFQERRDHSPDKNQELLP